MTDEVVSRRRENAAFFLRILAFVLIFTLISCAVLYVLTPKYDYGPGSMMNLPLQPRNTIDVLAVGTSTTYAAVNTNVLWANWGFSVYDLASAEQQYWHTYYYLEQALTTQHPKILLLDAKAATYPDDTTRRGRTILSTSGILNPIRRANAIAAGGQQQLFAYKNIPLTTRLAKYFSNLITVESIHDVPEVEGERGLSFTLHDPVYGGEKFSPAIIGNGTMHKYLLYFDNKFPYLHQNIIEINLGKSYSVNEGIDVATTMSRAQGSFLKSEITYPSGLTENSADDLHTATYLKDSRESSMVNETRFVDDYTNVDTVKAGKSKIGYSFTIGIIAVILSYVLAIPLGILMARKKDKLIDQIGTLYIVFIIAVPSLAYIFLFKAIGGSMGLPTTFDMESSSKLMYILPIISLALPQVANLMKWLRRYMIDQMNSDYVKFARSGGLTENEIFTKHILKNAAIPIVQGVPASVLGALIGAIITERVYVVPGAGNLLTEAINQYDNGVIVGVTLFYALLSVLAIILGDILMSMVDPRISFSTKDR